MTPFPSLSLLLALAPSHFHVPPGLPPELAEEPFQRGAAGPGPQPACHPAPCRPFQKHLLVEAAGSRLLCRGSQAGQLKCSLASCWWGA